MPVSLVPISGLRDLIDPRAKFSIVDTRTESEYDAGHIPGAIRIGWEDWCAQAPLELGSELQQPGYWGLLDDVTDADLEHRLSILGLNNDDPIVVYADGARTKGREGRVAWMLLYFGAKQVHLLDGGYTSWCASKQPIQIEHDAPAPGSFHIQRQPQRRTLLADLVSAAQSGHRPIMIDTRTHKEFIGENYSYMPRMGTIRDAIFLAHHTMFHADGTFVTKDEYLSAVPSAVVKNTNVVAFCEVGVRACNVALLHEIYTGKIMPVYDGSLMEWTADPNLPVVAQTK